MNPAMRLHAAHTSTAGRTPIFTPILRMDGQVLELGCPIITMVQSSRSIKRKHATRGYAASSAAWRSLAQPKVRAVFVMIADVLGKQLLQMPLVESNHMVEQFATAASHPTLGDTILPGTFEGGPHRIY